MKTSSRVQFNLIPKFVLCFFMTQTIIGCGTVIKIAYGVKNYKPRSPKQILNYAKKKDLLDLPNYFLDSETVKAIFKKSNGSLSLNNLLIFDSIGNEMTIKNLDRGNDSFCSSSIFEHIGGLPNNLSLKKESPLKKREIDQTKTRLSNSPKQKIINPKYYYIITWSMSAGRLNETISFKVSQALKDLNDSNIAISYLNLDLIKN